MAGRRHRVDDVAVAEWFRQVPVRAAVDRHLRDRGFIDGGHHHDREVAVFRQEFGDQLETRLPRHHHVDKGLGELVLVDPRPRLGTVAGDGAPVALGFEQRSEHLSDDRIVVDNQRRGSVAEQRWHLARTKTQLPRRREVIGVVHRPPILPSFGQGKQRSGPYAPLVTFDAHRWWAESGGAWLTGRADGPTLGPTGDVGAYATGLVGGSAADLLFGRAAFTGAHRDGSTATGGTARMVRCGDGWVVVNLARPADKASIAAVIEGDDHGDPFAAIEAWAAERSRDDVAARAQLFGVPAGVVGRADPATAVTTRSVGTSGDNALRVADLTSLWAGPTCARLLALAGARVTKIESTERPDGARRGSTAFYAWLHQRDADERAFAFTSDEGRAQLRAALNEADVVLESSRPRALRQLGIDAHDWLQAQPGRVWLCITGYGRDDPAPGRVAFGDDAAAAGGLVAYEPDGDGTPLFVGDAIADPLTGITAARAVLDCIENGGGELVSVSLAGVAARVVATHPLAPTTINDAAPPQPPKPDM